MAKKTKSKYDYKKLAKARKLSELEMNALLRFLNSGKDPELAKQVSELFDNNVNNNDGIALTPDHVKKGLEYLYNKGFTPTGRQRSNSPFGAREEYIITNAKTIRLFGFYDAGGFMNKYWIPLYDVIAKDGDTMEYYVWNGKISIVG